MKDYERVLDHTKGETRYPVGEAVEVLIRDPDTMESLRARAVILSSFDDPEADRLFYLSPTAGREQEPVPIKIEQFFSDETEEVDALPVQKLSLGQRRGTMLSDMIRERSDKKQS